MHDLKPTLSYILIMIFCHVCLSYLWMGGIYCPWGTAEILYLALDSDIVY